MKNNKIKKKVEEVFNESHRTDLQTRLNTFIFYLKKSNIDELTEIMGQVNIDPIIDKILEIDKETLKNYCINFSEIKGRLTESDFDKIRLICGPKGDVVVNKLKQLLDW
ncbi:hypothetical protein [Acetivibrio clariflavus]|uniref:hypothetical protein n=1 Tax=Acetivibrio clariflavus TaxID=288965 RepID=UPI000487A25A|nr:hypothetical protein [Acetivibrio clariflavus]